MEFFALLPPALLSYKFCNLISHPNSKYWYRLPHFKIKRLQLAPSVRVFVKGRVIHFHHWFYCSILLGASIYSSGGWVDSLFTKGLLMGGILQGYSMPEARKLVYKIEDAWKNFSRDPLRVPLSYPPKKIA